MSVPKVYKSILSVAGELSKSGISKDRKNQQQGYMFRGIDDLYNELAPLLVKHNLIILPNHISRSVSERPNRTGDSLIFTAILETEFTFVSTEDGSTHTIKIFGEAMDNSDKATNKAMSVAYKYAMIQAFCIPIVGEENEADAHTPQVKAPIQAPKTSTPKQAVVQERKPFTEDLLQKLVTRFQSGDVEVLPKVYENYRITKEWEEKIEKALDIKIGDK